MKTRNLIDSPLVLRRSGASSFVLIKPSHYDDDGYVIRWWRSIIPSNSLAALYSIGIPRHAARLVRRHRHRHRGDRRDQYARAMFAPACCEGSAHTAASGFVALVGVQSNQFPRALGHCTPVPRGRRRGRPSEASMSPASMEMIDGQRPRAGNLPWRWASRYVRGRGGGTASSKCCGMPQPAAWLSVLRFHE